MQLAYAHLNLKKNPFGQIPPADRAKLAVVDIEKYLPLIQGGGFVVQFIGEQGRGKSTHMRALHAHFPDAPFHYIGEGEKPTIHPAPILFLDETQRIAWWKRRHLWRACQSLVVGTHKCHAREYRSAGLSYEVVEVGGVTVETLQEIFRRRLEWARRDDGPIPWFEEETVIGLHQRFGDNIRAMEQHLYEVFQTMREVERVQA